MKSFIFVDIKIISYDYTIDGYTIRILYNVNSNKLKIIFKFLCMYVYLHYGCKYVWIYLCVTFYLTSGNVL